MFSVLVGILVSIIITFNFYKYLTLWRYIEKLPGPKTLPFIGNAHHIGQNPRGKYMC